MNYAAWIAAGITTSYELDGRGIEIQFSAEARAFSLLHSIQTGSWVHPASYAMDTGDCLPRG
jgi:hypothetical protein